MIETAVGPYRIVERLGAGGMGEVFLAEDTRLRRRVALKRLTGAASQQAEARRRIMGEARAVAQLHHQGISSIFDVFEDDATVWIVMEYIEGETLTFRLRRGPLTVDEAMDVGAQLADALADAHAHGIIHCDLKPLNIRLTPSGRAKILDFGLAQRSADAVASEATEMVSVGIGRAVSGVYGTAGYLAPERLAGTPPDARGDIYSLGVVLFQLLTGRCPFLGGDIVSTAVIALTTPAPSPSGIDAKIPEPISAVVLKALAARPEDRFQSAADLGSAIRAAAGEQTHAVEPARPTLRHSRQEAMRRWAWPVAGATVVAAAGVGILIAIGAPRLNHPAPLPDSGRVTSIVVKPFANAGGNSADDYLGSGFTDDLVMKLSLYPQASVVSRETTAAYLAAKPASSTLARDLGASQVVGGAITRSGDRLHVTIEILTAGGGREWTRDYNGTLSGLFVLQQQLAEGVADRLRLSATDRTRLGASPTQNVDAFADYSQGRLFLDRTDVRGNSAHAIDAFSRAIAKDPAFALAHAGLGAASWQKYVETTDGTWTLRALDASLEALRLNPAQAEVHVTLGTIYKGMGRTPAAIDELRRALALQPNADEAHRILGDIFAGQGQIDAAVLEFQRAIAIRPNYWQNHNRLAVALMSVGRYAEAESSCRRVTELQPDSHIGFGNLGAVAMMRGDLDLARASFERAAEIRPGASVFSNLGTLHFWNGRFDAARRAYAQAIAIAPGDPALHRNLGDALTELHDTDGARKAYLQALQTATLRLAVNPKDATSLSLVALIEAKLGRAADARAHVDQAIGLAPKSQDVYYRSSAVAALAGERDVALAALETAVTLGYSIEFAKRDLDLRSLRSLPEFSVLMNARKP